MKKVLFGPLLIFAIVCVVIVVLSKSYGFNMADIGVVPVSYWILGLSLSFAELFLRSCRTKLVIDRLGGGLSFFQALKTCMNVDFFAAITPSRFGGDPARWISFRRFGLEPSKALVAAAVEGLMDLCYILIGAGTVLYLTEGSQAGLLLVLNRTLKVVFLMIACIVLFVFWGEKGANKIPAGLLNILNGFGRWNFTNFVLKLRRDVIDSVKALKSLFLLGVFLTTSWWCVRFSSLLWIGKALGFSIGWKDVFVPQFLLFQSLIFTPIPGSGGAFEAAFLWVYRAVIPMDKIALSMLLWRTFTYYVFVAVGGVFSSKDVWLYLVTRQPEQRR